MVIVAVAGGTGDVGRTILDAIVNSGNHRAFVLSRTVSRFHGDFFLFRWYEKAFQVS